MCPLRASPRHETHCLHFLQIGVHNGSLYKLNHVRSFGFSPPLRTDAEVQAILAGLQYGTLDVISTDHAQRARVLGINRGTLAVSHRPRRLKSALVRFVRTRGCAKKAGCIFSAPPVAGRAPVIFTLTPVKPATLESPPRG